MPKLDGDIERFKEFQQLIAEQFKKSGDIKDALHIAVQHIALYDEDKPDKQVVSEVFGLDIDIDLLEQQSIDDILNKHLDSLVKASEEFQDLRTGLISLSEKNDEDVTPEEKELVATVFSGVTAANKARLDAGSKTGRCDTCESLDECRTCLNNISKSVAKLDAKLDANALSPISNTDVDVDYTQIDQEASAFSMEVDMDEMIEEEEIQCDNTIRETLYERPQDAPDPLAGSIDTEFSHAQYGHNIEFQREAPDSNTTKKQKIDTPEPSPQSCKDKRLK